MRHKIKLLMAAIAGWLLLFGTTLYAAGDAAVVEHFTTEDQVVLYIQGIEGRIDGISYQIGTTECEVVSLLPIGEAPEGIRTLILWDNSLSVMNKCGNRVKSILTEIVANRAAGEKFAIATIDSQTKYLSDYTDNYAELKQVIDGVTGENQEAYIIENLYEAIESLNRMNTADYKRILVISDGMDAMEIGYSRSELDALIEKTPYPIYTMGALSGNNTEELQNLFGLSRTTKAESFYLNNIKDDTEIIRAFRVDDALLQMKADIPEKIRDGSRCNSQIVIKSGGSNITMQSEITLPFGIQKEPTETPLPEEPLQEETTPEPEEALSEDIVPDQEESGKTRLGKFIWVIVFIAILCVAIIVLAIILAVKKRKAKPADESSNYNMLDSRIKNARYVGAGQSGAAAAAQPLQEDHNAKMQADHLQHTHRIMLVNLNDHQQMYQCSITGRVTVGRNSSLSTLVIADASVSSKHCEIWMQGERCYIRDMNSSNGTYVNNVRINEITEIATGTILEIGKYKYRVTLE